MGERWVYVHCACMYASTALCMYACMCARAFAYAILRALVCRCMHLNGRKRSPYRIDASYDLWYSSFPFGR